MRKEQKIILSLYYANPKMEPSNINEAKYSVGMDMVQLLFVMEGVFEKIEYKYYIEGEKIRSKPTGDKTKEYHELIDQSDNELKEAQVLAVAHGGKKLFQDLDYMEIDSCCNGLPDAKNYLYFFNILMGSVNGASLLGERETLIFYRLFSNRGGKEFLSCLLAMIVKFISAFLTGNEEEAYEVVEALNKDYELMQKAYGKGEDFLKNMWNRGLEARDMYQKNFFVNQSEKFGTWIEDRRSAIKRQDILEFIFYRNYAWKNYTRHFILHIIRISQILMQDKHRAVLWEKEYTMNGVPKMQEFYHLDKLVKQLEKEAEDPSFDIIGWAGEYNAKLFAFAKELNLCAASPQ